MNTSLLTALLQVYAQHEDALRLIRSETAANNAKADAILQVVSMLQSRRSTTIAPPPSSLQAEAQLNGHGQKQQGEEDGSRLSSKLEHSSNAVLHPCEVRGVASSFDVGGGDAGANASHENTSENIPTPSAPTLGLMLTAFRNKKKDLQQQQQQHAEPPLPPLPFANHHSVASSFGGLSSQYGGGPHSHCAVSPSQHLASVLTSMRAAIGAGGGGGNIGHHSEQPLSQQALSQGDLPSTAANVRHTTNNSYLHQFLLASGASTPSAHQSLPNRNVLHEQQNAEPDKTDRELPPNERGIALQFHPDGEEKETPSAGLRGGTHRSTAAAVLMGVGTGSCGAVSDSMTPPIGGGIGGRFPSIVATVSPLRRQRTNAPLQSPCAQRRGEDTAFPSASHVTAAFPAASARFKEEAVSYSLTPEALPTSGGGADAVVGGAHSVAATTQSSSATPPPRINDGGRQATPLLSPSDANSGTSSAKQLSVSDIIAIVSTRVNHEANAGRGAGGGLRTGAGKEKHPKALLGNCGALKRAREAAAAANNNQANEGAIDGSVDVATAKGGATRANKKPPRGQEEETPPEYWELS